MTDPISLTTTSIQFDLQRLNTIANNAANAMTPGFKREFLATVGQFDSVLMNQHQLPQPILSAVIDNKPGVQNPTGNPLDLALMNVGYFEVSTDYGYSYTRQGSFRLDEKGRLVTHQGQPVSGVSGDIYLSNPNPKIDSEGRIFEDGKLIGQIKVVAFDQTAKLVKVGGGFFIPSGPAEKQEIDHPKISQGHLESSNVDSAQEMVKLIETYRHFETSHKVIQAYDELNDKALKNLSQF